MITQVIFKIDRKLKDKAMERAQREGLPLASVLKLATKAYVDGTLKVGLNSEPKLNQKTEKVLLKALAEIKKGKNISPGFENFKDAVTYLKNL